MPYIHIYTIYAHLNEDGRTEGKIRHTFTAEWPGYRTVLCDFGENMKKIEEMAKSKSKSWKFANSKKWEPIN